MQLTQRYMACLRCQLPSMPRLEQFARFTIGIINLHMPAANIFRNTFGKNAAKLMKFVNFQSNSLEIYRCNARSSAELMPNTAIIVVVAGDV